MSLVSSAQAEEALTHLTHQFAQWRQGRTTPRGRIPKPLWLQGAYQISGNRRRTEVEAR